MIAVTKHRNISKAAQSLYISQTALSRFIKNLEKHVGCNLFIREGQKIELSNAGKKYIEHAWQIALQKYFLISEISTINESKILNLIIGIMPYNGKLLLPETLNKFRKKYPNINVQIIEQNSCNIETLLIEKSRYCYTCGTPPQITDLK